MAKESSSLHYINYLALDKILEAQHPLSGNGKSARARGDVIYYNTSNL